jgi:hypothetical protein
MNIQYITDYKGDTTGIFIPIQDWEYLTKRYQGLEDVVYEKEPTKEEILEGLKEAINEVKLHKKGKIKLKSLDELLNEL